MARPRSDLRAMLLTGAAAIAAGLGVAALLLLVTGRDKGPTEYEPFDAGVAAGIVTDLQDGGPYYVPDPFGGDRSILFALEDGDVVALSVYRPGRDGCVVRYRDAHGGFVDCDGNVLRTTQMARYVTEVPTTGHQEGELLVDLRTLLPPPEGTPSSASAS